MRVLYNNALELRMIIENSDKFLCFFLFELRFEPYLESGYSNRAFSKVCSFETERFANIGLFLALYTWILLVFTSFLSWSCIYSSDIVLDRIFLTYKVAYV